MAILRWGAQSRTGVLMRQLRALEIAFKELPWIASRWTAGFSNPAALEFYRELIARGYEPASLINVLPDDSLIYITVPKAASTRIRRTLARVENRLSRSLKPGRKPTYRGPYGPRNISLVSFHRLATSKDTLRFSFVRNPYARAVSCWTDKFAGKPLVPGDPFIDGYLAVRRNIDPRLPVGPDRTLSFADFVAFAAGIAAARHNIHLQLQDDILAMPGLKLDLIGKVETFNADFASVLDHLNASDDIRRDAALPINRSRHEDWPTYYTAALADRIYRAYERDFDRFGYPRTFVAANCRMAKVSGC